MTSRNKAAHVNMIRSSYRTSPGVVEEDVQRETRLPFRRTQSKRNSPSLSRTPSPSVALPPHSASRPEPRELSVSLGATSRGSHVFASLDRCGGGGGGGGSSFGRLPSPKLKKNIGRKSPAQPPPETHSFRDSARRKEIKKEGHRDAASVVSHVSKSVRLRSGSQGTEIEALGDADFDDTNALFSKIARGFQEEKKERSPRDRSQTDKLHSRKGPIDEGGAGLHKEPASYPQDHDDSKSKLKNRSKSAPSFTEDAQSQPQPLSDEEDDCNDDEWGGISLGDLSSLGFDDFLSQIKSVDEIERFKQALDARKNHLQKGKSSSSKSKQRSTQQSSHHKSHRSKRKDEEPLPITPRYCEPLVEEQPLKPTATFATANSAALVSAAVSLSSCDGSLSPSGGSSMSGSYRKYDEGEDLAKEIKVSHARRPKKGCTSHRFRYEGARAPDDKMFSSSSIGVHDDKYDDFDARNIEYESDCYVSGDRDHERDEVREREISEGLRRRGYNETRTNAPLSDTSSLTSTSTAGHRRDRHLSRKQHGPEDNTSSRGSSPMSAWSCPSPRSPSHLTSKPPSFVPRIRLEAMHAVETSSREGGSAPRGNGSDLALPSPRSAFSDPREE